MTKNCWICGNKIMEHTTSSVDTYYGIMRIMNVYVPYALNSTSDPMYICQSCMKEKIGISHKGERISEKEQTDYPFHCYPVCFGSSSAYACAKSLNTQHKCPSYRNCIHTSFIALFEKLNQITEQTVEKEKTYDTIYLFKHADTNEIDYLILETKSPKRADIISEARKLLKGKNLSWAIMLWSAKVIDLHTCE